MHIDEQQLRDFIIDSGLVSRGDVTAAERESEGGRERTSNDAEQSIGRILVRRGKLSEDDLRRIKGAILGMPFVDLKNQKHFFEILSHIPEPIARQHNIVAFKKTDAGLEVAMLDADDLSAVDFVGKKFGLKILPRLTDSESMKQALLQYQKFLKAEFGDVIARESSALRNFFQKKSVGEMSEDDLSWLGGHASSTRIVETLLRHAVLQNASDIHIEPQENELLVRYRIHGVLRDAMILPKNAGVGVATRIKMLAGLKLDEKNLLQDGRFNIETDGEKISFRVSTLPTSLGEKITLRVLREGVGFTLEALGFHGAGLEKIHKALHARHGMILATGDTGSGKTTTLYTMLDILNTPNTSIATIEDPIEYHIKRVCQTQVRPEIGLSFAGGLRAILRQDPDVVMVGELRDSETATLALHSALTGHLALSAVPAKSATSAVTRLLEMHIEPTTLVTSVEIIIAHKLARRLSDKKEKYFLSKSELQTLGKSANLEKVLKALKEEKIVGKSARWEEIAFWRPSKSATAQGDGYSGHVGLHEVLKISPAIKDMIMKGGSEKNIQKQTEAEGMLTLLEDGIFKCVEGLTTIEEIFKI